MVLPCVAADGGRARIRPPAAVADMSREDRLLKSGCERCRRGIHRLSQRCEEGVIRPLILHLLVVIVVVIVVLLLIESPCALSRRRRGEGRAPAAAAAAEPSVAYSCGAMPRRRRITRRVWSRPTGQKQQPPPPPRPPRRPPPPPLAARSLDLLAVGGGRAAARRCCGLHSRVSRRAADES